MSVTLRRIETSLQRMIRRPGGIKAEAAIEAANERLAQMEEVCLEQADLHLARIMELAAPGDHGRLSPEDLKAIVAEGEATLTLCGAIRLPLLGETLRLLCAHAEALAHADYWPDRALAPALDMLKLARADHIPEALGKVALQELERCLIHYRGHAVTDSPP